MIGPTCAKQVIADTARQARYSIGTLPLRRVHDDVVVGLTSQDYSLVDAGRHTNELRCAINQSIN